MEEPHSPFAFSSHFSSSLSRPFSVPSITPIQSSIHVTPLPTHSLTVPRDDVTHEFEESDSFQNHSLPSLSASSSLPLPSSLSQSSSSISKDASVSPHPPPLEIEKKDEAIQTFPQSPCNPSAVMATAQAHSELPHPSSPTPLHVYLQWAGVVLSMVAVQVIVSLYSVVIYLFAEQGTPPNPCFFTLLRAFLAFPFILGISRIFEGPLLLPTVAEVPYFLTLGFTGFGFCQWLYMRGVLYTSPNTAVILLQTVPVLTLTLAMVMGSEPLPTWRDKASLLAIPALLLTVCGSLFALVYPTLSSSPSSPSPSSRSLSTSSDSEALGVSLLIVSAVFDSLYYVLQKHFLFLKGPVWMSQDIQLGYFANMRSLLLHAEEHVGRHFGCIPYSVVANDREGSHNSLHPSDDVTLDVPISLLRRWVDFPLSFTAYATLIGSVPLLTPALYIVLRTPSELVDFDIDAYVIPLIYAVVGCSCIVGALTLIGLKYLPSSTVAAFRPLQVVTSVVASSILLDQWIVLSDAIGGAMIISGLVMVISIGIYNEYRNGHEERL